MNSTSPGRLTRWEGYDNRRLFSLKERPYRHEIEGHCCRVFLDPAGKDPHRSTRRDVPLGETTPQARQC
jgi:hypothetical protein